MWRTFFATRTEVTTGDDLRCSINCAPLTFSTGRKHTVWFALKGDDPRPLFAFAGIWQPYDGPLNGRDQKNGVTHKVNTFSFLTTVPNELVATINHERMVVILTRPEEFDQWLNGTVDEAMELAKPFSAEMMQIVQEGFSKQDDLLAAA
jgi:putative SOS response-associated peptidase YedK